MINVVKKYYSFVRLHSIFDTIIWVVVGSILFGLSGSVLAEGQVGILNSTEAYWGYGLGATSGYAFGEYLHSKAWKLMVTNKDNEIARLTLIEQKYNILRDEALKKVNGN